MSYFRNFFKTFFMSMGVKFLNFLPLERIYRLRDFISEHLENKAISRRKGRHLTHRAYGKLVFQESPYEDKEIPIHNMEVELWDRHLGLTDCFLARGMTDQEGKFELWYDPNDLEDNSIDLDLRVIDTSYYYGRTGQVMRRRKTFDVIKGDDDIETKSYDFGTCAVPYWEYGEGALPRVETKHELLGGLPQDFTEGRKVIGYKVLAPITRAQFRCTYENLDVAQIQEEYPRNKTLKMEMKQPGSTRSKEYLIDRVLNGFNMCLFRKDKQGRYFVDFSYDGMELDDVHFARNTRAYFSLTEGKSGANDELKIDGIEVSRPLGPEDTNRTEESVLYTPEEDAERFKKVMRLFRVNYTAFGQVTAHLVPGHFNTEQYAVAGYRNLRKSPIANLLLPHLKGVIIINKQAATGLLGEEGFVIQGSAFTWDCAQKVVVNTMGHLDWAGFKPRTPFCGGHRYAYIAGLYWESLREYLDWYFTTYQKDIEANWFEIQAFSRELVEHSVPYQKPLDDWVCFNEINDNDEFRQEINGMAKAVSAITTSPTPNPRDMENLKQCCAYVIYHATFYHGWANDEQYDDGGEVMYATMGLTGDIINGDDDIAITPYEANTQLFFANFLTRIKYGYVVKNEDSDIHPRFANILKSKKDEFLKHRFHPSFIRSRINI